MRLVDCFFELFYYTLFIKSLDFSQLTYKNVIKHYKDLFSRSLQTAKKAGFSQNTWGKGLFAVCAWIDEYILISSWSERAKWQRYPLQLFFFKTTNAGEDFFTRLEGLGPDEKSIREVYEYCLALGFKGRYYDSGTSGKLGEIKQANLRKFTENYKLVFPDITFPEAYALPGTERKKGRLKGPWGLSLVTIALGTLPLILFAVLFYIFRNSLAGVVMHYVTAGH